MQTHFNQTIVEPQTIQQPTVHDIDAVNIRHAIWEVCGLAALGAALLIIHFKFNGFNLEQLANGLFEMLVIELVVIGCSFLFKEPAIESVARVAFATLRQRIEQSAEPARQAELYVRTSNQADEDFLTAMNILDAYFRTASKENDGETLKTKPFSYQNCAKSKLVSRWQDWGRVMDLWEKAGIALHPRDRSGRVVVASMNEARIKLSALYRDLGYIWVRDTWMKR